MKKLAHKINFACLLPLTIIVYVAYYLLLRENYLGSISSIISFSHHLNVKPHIVVLGLLPVYIATMIFGAAVLGLYLGYRLDYIFARYSVKTSYQHYLRKSPLE